MAWLKPEVEMFICFFGRTLEAGSAATPGTPTAAEFVSHDYVITVHIPSSFIPSTQSWHHRGTLNLRGNGRSNRMLIVQAGTAPRRFERTARTGPETPTGCPARRWLGDVAVLAGAISLPALMAGASGRGHRASV